MSNSPLPGVLIVLCAAFPLGWCAGVSFAGAFQEAAGSAIIPPGAPFPMAVPALPAIPAREFDIRTYGAREGGTFKNTGAIRDAIQAASHAGGGVVVIPGGKWLTGAIRLENNVALRVARNAELLFSSDPADYLPVVFARHEEIECFKYSSFIYAEGRKNIAITGEGVLNGQGEPWWKMKEDPNGSERLLYEMGGSDVPVADRVFDGSGGHALRPSFFQPVRCTNVLVEGVTFRYGAMWTIVPTYCDSVTVRNVTVTTAGERGRTPNGDGVDISSSKNVLIENCTFDTGDDCIAIKAGRDRDGLRVGLPSENIVIRGCRVLHGHGGIVIGSETSGGVRNVFAHDCSFKGTDRMVRIKTARGRGGAVENLWFRDLRGEEIASEAIHINTLYAGAREPAGVVSASTPRVRNVWFANIVCTSGGGYAVEILGLPEMPVENISFDTLTMTTARGIHLADVRTVRFAGAHVLPGTPPVISVTDGAGVMLNGASASTLPAPTGRPPRIDTSIPWSARIAESFLRRHPDAVTYDSEFPSAKWIYEQGVMLAALRQMADFSGDQRYGEFVRNNIDQYVAADGNITTYRYDEFQLDNISPGTSLLALYGETRDERYRKAAGILRAQLREQPRTSGGGIWHKRIYPSQMWLDGLYMAGPFYARYGRMFGEPADLDDVLQQFRLITAHCRDPKTGLYYHGWDETKTQGWADSATGCSPVFWGRSMGWLIMALVDVLDYIPDGHPGKDELAGTLRGLAGDLLRVRDPETALWYQVPDEPRRAGNYPEASSSAMFAYAFAKGANRHYLAEGYLAAARQTFAGIVRHCVSVDSAGFIDLHHICAGAGLGGTPYRNGSYDYYVSVPQRTNDMKGYAPFLLAAIELEKAAAPAGSGGRQENTPR
jgi:unsaturated rhamnogalacturonyl hydrolase